MGSLGGKVLPEGSGKCASEAIFRLEATPRLSGVTPIFEMRMGSTVLIMASVSCAWSVWDDHGIVASMVRGFEPDAFCLYGKPDRYRWTHP